MTLEIGAAQIRKAVAHEPPWREKPFARFWQFSDPSHQADNVPPPRRALTSDHDPERLPSEQTRDFVWMD
jgi:hypothetical protein